MRVPRIQKKRAYLSLVQNDRRIGRFCNDEKTIIAASKNGFWVVESRKTGDVQNGSKSKKANCREIRFNDGKM